MTGNNRANTVIQERDQHLLRELDVMRVIDREQAKEVAGFGSTTRANASLGQRLDKGLPGEKARIRKREADLVHPVFLEVDLGTERLGIWREKVRSYLRLAISGEFQRLFGRERFRVLVLTTTDRRLLSLRREIASATRKIFWLSTFGQVTSSGFWSPCWLRPQGDEKLALF